MNKDNVTPIDQPLSPQVVDTARSLYSPPGGDSYWQSLELKVMAGIQGMAPKQWWQVLGTWSQKGIMAAAAAIIIIAALLFQANRKQSEIAYVEAIIDFDNGAEFVIPEGVLNSGIQSDYQDPGIRAATFRDVISR